MKPLYKTIGLAAFVLSIPLAAQANTNPPGYVWLYNFVDGGLQITQPYEVTYSSELDPNGTCLGKEQCAIVQNGQIFTKNWGGYNSVTWPAQNAFNNWVNSFPATTYSVNTVNFNGSSVGAKKTTYDPNNDPNGICINQSECYIGSYGEIATDVFSFINVANAAQPPLTQEELEAMYPPADQTKVITGNYTNGNLIVEAKAYDPSWDPEGICLGANECWYVPDGSVHTHVNPANEAWIAYQVSLTFPENLDQITEVKNNGAASWDELDVSTFDPDAPGAEECLNQFACYLVDGTYYNNLGDAKDAFIIFNQATLEASYPETTYELTDINEDGTVVKTEVEFDYSIQFADNCLNEDTCYLYNGVYYGTEAFAADSLAADIAAYEASLPKKTYNVTGFHVGGGVKVSETTYNPDAPGAEVCLHQAQCFIYQGNYYVSAQQVENVHNAAIAAAEEAAFAASLATQVASTAAINAPIRFDQYSDPIATDSFDVVDNFRYQKSATSHRIRLRIADNTYFNDNWSTAVKSDTQSLIVGLAQDVFKKGFAEGYETGFKEGYEDGYIEGYDQGYLDYHANN